MKSRAIRGVMSDQTDHTDRIVKTREYGKTDSIMRYIILAQTSMAATVFTHTNGVWAGVIVEGVVDLEIPEIGIALPLAEFYLDVKFPPEDAAAALRRLDPVPRRMAGTRPAMT